MGLFDPQTALIARTGSRHIDAADVIALLQEVYADGIVTREEAEELIAFDLSLAHPTSGWTEFFAATIADHVLFRQSPLHLVDDDKAGWLMKSLGKGRHAGTPGGFAAVLRLIETARDVTPVLTAYAVRQVRSAVLSGRRPATTIRLFLNRTVDGETALLVRRIILGCAGQAARPITRTEAEALFDLHDLTAGGTNDPDFEDLFFKSIAHHLIAQTGQKVPPRPEAIARGGEFPRGTAGGVLGGDETAWLASQIMRDGRPTSAELKLLQLFGGRAVSADAVREFSTRAA